jgi:hypothetical protein
MVPEEGMCARQHAIMFGNNPVNLQGGNKRQRAGRNQVFSCEHEVQDTKGTVPAATAAKQILL